MGLEKALGKAILFLLLSSSAFGFVERPSLSSGQRLRNLALVTRPYRQTTDWTVDGNAPLIRIDQIRTKEWHIFPRPEFFERRANHNVGSVAPVPEEYIDSSTNGGSIGLVAPRFSAFRSLTHGLGSSAINLSKRYSCLCQRRPLITKSIAAAVLAVVGSYLSQRIEAHIANTIFSTNWNRLATFFLCGCLFQGPSCHLWYGQLWKLGRWMERTHGCSKEVQTFAQVVINQTLGVAIFLPAFFYVFECFEALVDWRVPLMAVATSKLQKSIASVLLMQYYVWPFFNWFTFTYVPENLREVLNNVLSVFWNAYLCMALAK